MPPITRALVRRPPRAYLAYYAAEGVAIDLPLADSQHAAYVAALESAGVAVSRIAPDETMADAVFIEDTGVVYGGRMLVTRMVPRREGEQRAVVAHLRATHEIVSLPDGARLEGGDVMHADEVTYVGLTARTNQAGVEALREFLAPAGRSVIAVPVTGCLHLKTAATWLGDGTLLAATEHVDVNHFSAETLITTAPGEAKAANSLRINDALLVLANYPETLARVRAFAEHHELRLLPLDVSEFEKGDGSLTCLSIVY